MTTSTPTAQPTDFIFLISAVVLSALVLIVLLTADHHICSDLLLQEESK